MINPACFRDYHWYKYVVFDNGTVVFGNVGTHHKELRREVPDQNPVAAGKIKYNSGTFSFDEKGSFTLNIKDSDQDSVRDLLKTVYQLTEAEGEAFY